MSLTLKESTNKYEKFHRQKQFTMSFAKFNVKYGTCLPENEAVQKKFWNSLAKAKNSEGIPVTRRLYSIYHGLTETSREQIATLPPSQQIAHKPSNPTIIASRSVEQNIRSPTIIANKQMSTSDPLEKYQSLLEKEDPKFFDKKGLMVHFVEFDGIPLLGNTCKLNKRNAEALYTGKGQLTMRNQNTIEMESFQLNVEDHHKFMLARKNKETGPYFIRIPK